MKIVITGGNGFIGSHLVAALAVGDAEITVVDRGKPRLDTDWKKVRYVQGSFDDPAVLDRVIPGADLVYHLASTSVPGTANQDPVLDIQGNLIGTLELVQAMERAGCQRIIFLSSGGTVYGESEAQCVAEDAACRPISSYGIVKHAIERYLLMSERAGRLRPVILRPSNPYGARQGKLGLQGLVSTAIDRISNGQPLEIWGDGSAIRDYIYIDDLVDLMVKACRSEQTGIFNAGSGDGASVLDIIREVSSALSIDAMVRYGPGRAFDVARIVLDVERSRATFGWSPVTGLREGIRATVNSWKDG